MSLTSPTLEHQHSNIGTGKPNTYQDDNDQSSSVQFGDHTQDYESASQLLKQKGGYMLLIFSGSDWCGWCKLMDGNVFSKKEWEKTSASMKLISVLIDFPQNQALVPAEFRSRNQSLKGKYGIRGYPTYVVFEREVRESHFHHSFTHNTHMYRLYQLLVSPT